VYISEVSDAAFDYNSEFIEIYNNSDNTLDLNSSKLVMLADGTVFTLSNYSGDITIPSKGLLVIARGATLEEFETEWGPLPAGVNYNQGSSNMYFGTGRQWRLRDGGTVGVDDGTILDDTQQFVAPAGSRHYQDPIGVWNLEDRANATPGVLEGNQDSSLPVELTSFTVVSGDGLVTLRWITESEMDNVGFEVFRSAEKDGEYTLMSSYLSNASLKGQVNSNTRHEYRFTDRLVVNGESYWYKLADVDLNGNRAFHGPLFAMPHQGSGAVLSDGNIPEKFALRGNYPNPFNPRTTIIFDIPQLREGVTEASLLVYNALGQQVRVLYQGNIAAGQYRLEWDGSGENGNSLPSGIYYAVLQTEQFVKTIKMLLLK
ncbi:MAG: FlgD immunoglobulin-like domain containing protein, partial [Calditrichia bacterium]